MIGQHILDDIERLKREAEYCYLHIVLPNWGSEYLHGFPDILYGLVMGVMSRIDLVSAYYDNNSKPQTKRMVGFLNKYMNDKNELNSVLINMWRHQLMHTSSPRDFTDINSNIRYRWLLHWREHLPIKMHYTFVETGNSKIINIGLIYLIDQFTEAVKKYLYDLNLSTELQTKYYSFEQELNSVIKRIN
jgi:hypothetical protein